MCPLIRIILRVASGRSRWDAATGCSAGPRWVRKLSGSSRAWCRHAACMASIPTRGWSMSCSGSRDPSRPGCGSADATPVEGPLCREPDDIRCQQGRAHEGDAGSLTITNSSGRCDTRRQGRRKMSAYSATTVSGPAQCSLALRPAWSLNCSCSPLTPGCFSPCRYLHKPPWLLPTGASGVGRGSHPPERSALPWRT